MRKTHTIILLVIGILFFPSFCFSQSADEEVPPRYSDSSFPDSMKSFFRKGKVKYRFSFLGGYDTNVYLDEDNRNGASFTQISFQSILTSPLGEQTDGVLSYDLMSLIYPDEHKLNLIDNGLGLGLKHSLGADLKFSANYHFGMTDYVNTGGDDFLDQRIEFKLKQNLPENFYHSLGYKFMFKDYSERKIRTTAGISAEKGREDIRNTVEYELGKYFSKDLVKLKCQFYENNSNESYLDYYDYFSYRTKVSLTHLFNDDLFGYCSFSRQMRDYRKRTLSGDSNSKTWDRTYVITSALYYNLKEDVSLGLSYTYRQNWSNEASQRYSGSTISTGIYYTF